MARTRNGVVMIRLLISSCRGGICNGLRIDRVVRHGGVSCLRLPAVQRACHMVEHHPGPWVKWPGSYQIGLDGVGYRLLRSAPSTAMGQAVGQTDQAARTVAPTRHLCDAPATDKALWPYDARVAVLP